MGRREGRGGEGRGIHGNSLKNFLVPYCTASIFFHSDYSELKAELSDFLNGFAQKRKVGIQL